MKKFLFFSSLLCLAGCWGNSSTNNEIIAQPKQLFYQTPLVCGNRVDADVSLGVMRNGVGSMSTQDMMLTLTEDIQEAALSSAIKNGKLVKISYNRSRWEWCRETDLITSVEILP